MIDLRLPRPSATAALRACALAASALLLLPPALRAQAAAAPPPRSLQIAILDGEGALNNIQARTAREPIVQVQDENHKPVGGALVLFAIHQGDSGAGAAFANGATQLSVTTGPDGTATAHGLALNHNSGSWQITVTATDGPLTASALINEISFAPLEAPQSQAQEPVPPAFHALHWFTSRPVLLIGSGLALGAVITYVIVNPPATAGTFIVPGSPSVGPPTAALGLRIRK